MQQILQDIKNGRLEIVDVPIPALGRGGLRIRTAASVISGGSEKTLVELAQKSLVGMAQARPDLVRQVLTKARKEGLVSTYRAVTSRMERPMPLGYSAAGVVEAVGEDVVGFRVGDRVAVGGAGYASHAEVNFVPMNLAARIPDGVTFEEAAYTTIGSIALQGVRIAQPELGDAVAVVGLGLIGLITVELLKANGCRVIGIDIDPSKAELAAKLGADAATDLNRDVTEFVADFTNGRGVDHVLITAGSKSSQPVVLAGDIARRKATVVAVGAVGLDVPRDQYYKKELELKLSMSYGPGRYDPLYEEGGIDYPFEYVRWTENRNMQAFLDLMGRGKVDPRPLTTHRFRFENALSAYKLLDEGEEPYVGILLEYDSGASQSAVVRVREPAATPVKTDARDVLRVGFVGAGNYATLHLLPRLSDNSAVTLRTLVTATGLNARQKADRFGFELCTTDYTALLDDDEIDAIFIATPHSTHSEYVEASLKAGKHVFVEKPMVVSEDQLSSLKATYEEAQSNGSPALMVGLNRRFSPLVRFVQEGLESDSPRQMIYRVNSGHIPQDSWVYAPDEGGGMMIGEMCHFLDVMQFLANSRPMNVFAKTLSLGRSDVSDRDNVVIVVSYEDGSVGTLCYNTVGDKACPKERLEVFGGAGVAILDDFRRASVYRRGKRTRKRLANQDKGQENQVEQSVASFCGGISPITFEDLHDVMMTVFAARKSVQSGELVSLTSD